MNPGFFLQFIAFRYCQHGTEFSGGLLQMEDGKLVAGLFIVDLFQKRYFLQDLPGNGVILLKNRLPVEAEPVFTFHRHDLRFRIPAQLLVNIFEVADSKVEPVIAENMNSQRPAFRLVPIDRGQEENPRFCQEIAYFFELVHENGLLFSILNNTAQNYLRVLRVSSAQKTPLSLIFIGRGLVSLLSIDEAEVSFRSPGEHRKSSFRWTGGIRYNIIKISGL